MARDIGVMDRRKFLFKSATLFAGSFLGLNCLSKAFASDNPLTTPQIALIIDDIGFSKSRLDRFLSIESPITFSVLPRLSRSAVFAEKIHCHGHEVMLHQPMEPSNPRLDPGPGAVYVGDAGKKITRIIGENISDVPYVSGINNHMGSRFTARPKEMKNALEAVKMRKLFFVDSLTTSRSMAYETARQLHMGTARRNLFLDHHPEERAIKFQLQRLKTHAIRFGQAIGIGHPYPQTAMAIKSFKDDLKASNISLVHVSSLIPA